MATVFVTVRSANTISGLKYETKTNLSSRRRARLSRPAIHLDAAHYKREIIEEELTGIFGEEVFGEQVRSALLATVFDDLGGISLVDDTLEGPSFAKKKAGEEKNNYRNSSHFQRKSSFGEKRRRKVI